jgi:hypothetical protein
MSNIASFAIPVEMLARVTEEANELNCSRSEVVRRALIVYFCAPEVEDYRKKEVFIDTGLV